MCQHTLSEGLDVSGIFHITTKTATATVLVYGSPSNTVFYVFTHPHTHTQAHTRRWLSPSLALLPAALLTSCGVVSFGVFHSKERRGYTIKPLSLTCTGLHTTRAQHYYIRDTHEIHASMNNVRKASLTRVSWWWEFTEFNAGCACVSMCGWISVCVYVHASGSLCFSLVRRTKGIHTQEQESIATVFVCVPQRP